MVQVFISWSLPRSQYIASQLHDWFRTYMYPDVTGFISREIGGGQRWAPEVAKQLSACNFGVLCVTPENKDRPWLLYEAGALSRDPDQSRLFPYLYGLENDALGDPLAQFQGAGADRDGTWALVLALNAFLRENRRDMDTLRRAFDHNWPQLHSALQRVPAARSTVPDTPRWDDMIKRLREFVSQEGSRIPFDYYFLNHTSRLRPDKQLEFQAKTGYAAGPIYNIRVRVESHYDHTLAEVASVRYNLEAYPQPVQEITDCTRGFLLKELAWGPPVVLAEIKLRDESVIRLSRFLTLMKNGPVLPEEFHARYADGITVRVRAVPGGFRGSILDQATVDQPVYEDPTALELEHAKRSVLSKALRTFGEPRYEISWERRTPSFEPDL